jgi:RNA polymerase sigma-70 factor (ECF subfamily)
MTIVRSSVWPDIILPAGVPAAATPPEVAVLTARLARADEEAWREFFGLYFIRLLRYLLVLHRGSEDLARESLQLTMVRVARHVRCFHSEDAFWSWLTVLARSAAADESRKRRSYWKFLDRFRTQPPPEASPDGDDAWESALARGLARLLPDERELIERKYFDRLSVRELSRAEGASEKAIDSRLVRARRKLKEFVIQELAG